MGTSGTAWRAPVSKTGGCSSSNSAMGGSVSDRNTLVEVVRAAVARRTALIAELRALDQTLTEAKAMLRDADRTLYATTGAQRHLRVRQRPIRLGSTVWWAHRALTAAGRPLPLGELLEVIRVDHDGVSISSPALVSNLSRYVMRGDTFTRPAPGVFGLRAFDDRESSTDAPHDELL